MCVRVCVCSHTFMGVFACKRDAILSKEITRTDILTKLVGRLTGYLTRFFPKQKNRHIFQFIPSVSQPWVCKKSEILKVKGC